MTDTTDINVADRHASVQLGDMTVVGDWPAKTMKALAVIATSLHPAYDAFPDASAGGSMEACMFSSLAIRDFLVAIGYPDATARPCACYMRAVDKADKEIWSVGVGKPGEPSLPGKYNGHAVTIIPSLKLMIETTLYRAIRPQWNGALKGMIALPYYPIDTTQQKIWDRYKFSGAEIEMPDRTFEIVWTDRPEIKLNKTIDFKRMPRRAAVTKALIETFGEWHE